MRCHNCNCENKKEARFCYNCGEPLESSEENKNKTGIIIAIVAVVIIGIICFLAFGLKDNAENKETKVETEEIETHPKETKPKETEAPKVDPVDQFVTNMYKNILGRNVDENGLKDWNKKLKSKSITGRDFVYNLITSPEFKAKKMSNETYIKILYRSLFGYEANAENIQYWKKEIAKGKTRQDVFDSFVESEKFTRYCAKFGVKSK